MPITAKCPGCGQIYHVKDELAGKTATCKCKKKFKIPAAAAAAPSAAAQASDGRNRCPTCGSVAESGAIICIVCGYNFRTKKRVGSDVRSGSETITKVKTILKVLVMLVVFATVAVVLYYGFKRAWPAIKGSLRKSSDEIKASEESAAKFAGPSQAPAASPSPKQAPSTAAPAPGSPPAAAAPSAPATAAAPKETPGNIVTLKNDNFCVKGKRYLCDFLGPLVEQSPLWKAYFQSATAKKPSVQIDLSSERNIQRDDNGKIRAGITVALQLTALPDGRSIYKASRHRGLVETPLPGLPQEEGLLQATEQSLIVPMETIGAIVAISEMPEPAEAVMPLLAEAAKDADSEVRAAVAQACGKWGPKAKPAAGVLVELLADPNADVRGAAADALRKMGPDSIEALVAGLSHKSGAARATSARLLGELGPKAAMKAVAILGIALNDPDVDVRKAVIEALEKMGPLVAGIVPALTRALTDKDPAVRASAAKTLGALGEDAASASSALVDLLMDPDNPSVFQAAFAALGKIGPKSASAIVRKLDKLSAKTLSYNAASDLILRFGAAAAEALAGGIKENPKALGGPCSDFLLKIGGDKVKEEFVSMLKHSNSQVRAIAVSALSKIGPLPEESLPVIIELASSADKRYKILALTTLNERVAPVESLMNQTAKLMGDDDVIVRALAEQYIAKYGVKAVNLLANMLSSSNLNERRSAIGLLAALGPGAATAKAAIKKATGDPDPGVSAAAKGLLGDRDLTPPGTSDRR